MAITLPLAVNKGNFFYVTRVTHQC